MSRLRAPGKSSSEFIGKDRLPKPPFEISLAAERSLNLLGNRPKVVR